MATKKYLVQDGVNYYSNQSGTMTNLGAIAPTEVTFTTSGMSEAQLASLTSSFYSTLTSPKLAIYVSDTTTLPVPTVTPTLVGTVQTTSTTSIPLTGYSGIQGLTVVDSSAKYLVSFDGKVTWKSYSGGEWIVATDVLVQGMTSTTLNALSPAQWGTAFEATQLDLMIMVGSYPDLSIDSTLTVGTSPGPVWGDSTAVYVCNFTSSTVSKINRADRAITSITVGYHPVAIWGDATAVYTVNSNNNGASVTKINRADNATTSISIGNYCSDIWGDANKVYVACEGANWVKVINRSDNVVTSILSAQSLGKVWGDGTYVYAAGTTSIFRILRSDNTYITVSAFSGLPTSIYGDTSYIYVANSASNNVLRINRSDNTTTTIAVGLSPNRLWGDASNVYVSNTGSTFITKIRKTDSFTTSIELGVSPSWLSGDADNIYVVSSTGNNFMKIDKISNTIVSLTVGTAPSCLWVDPGSVCVVNSGSNNVSLVKTSVTATYTGLTLSLPPNMPPTISNATVSTSSTHKENVIFTADVNDIDHDNVQYQIKIDGVVFKPWSVAQLSPFSISETIPYADLPLSPSSHSIVLEVKDASENLYASPAIIVTRTNTTPAVTVTQCNSRGVRATIGDADNDNVAYRVLLNGSEVQEWTDLLASPAQVDVVFNRGLVIFGQQNNVKIEYKDELGTESFVDEPFIGSYMGIMFTDEIGGYYSDDQGSVIKRLDFGVIVAGTTSLDKPVIIKNQTGYPLKNIEIRVDPESVVAYNFIKLSSISGSSEFENLDVLYIPGVLNDGDTYTIYVDTSSTTEAVSGGTFKLNAKAQLV